MVCKVVALKLMCLISVHFGNFFACNLKLIVVLCLPDQGLHVSKADDFIAVLLHQKSQLFNKGEPIQLILPKHKQ